ncbi:MAG: type 1 glutamine amidotransferase, partial [bacterium]|nr:type 1 glutamine amidotransferase [bacterium]
KLPKILNAFDAIVIGGSMHDSIKRNEKPWMKRTFKFIEKVAEQNIPILGICGGLQFTVRAFRGEVIRNPKGREFGTINVGLTVAGKQDNLFKGLPAAFLAQSSHKCMARNLRPGWRLLASSDLCLLQAIAVGKNIRLLQFHPEMTARQLRALAHYKKEPVPNIKNAERYGKKILNNFLKYFILPYHKKKLL